VTSSISRNIASIYVSQIVAAGATFIFWVISSNFTNPEIIGKVTAVASFCMILGVLSNFDIGVGMKRFLGKAVADKQWCKFKQISSISLLFVFSTSIGILLIVLNPFIDFLGMLGIEKQFVPVIIIIVLGNDLQHIFLSSIISSMKSKSIIIPYLISTLGRFPVLFGLFYLMEVSELSVAFAYSTSYLILTLSLFFVSLKIYKKIPGSYFYNAGNNLKMLIRGSLPRWIPQIITTVGAQASILSVFAIKGATEAGLFYIPFAIFQVLFLFSSAINQVSHPLLSGMENKESRKIYLWRTLKITFLISMPIASIVFFYAEGILSIFGPEFVGGNEILGILITGFPALLLCEGVYYLLYARGHYRNVLYLGLLANVPRNNSISNSNFDVRWSGRSNCICYRYLLAINFNSFFN